jgi:phasin family protein
MNPLPEQFSEARNLQIDAQFKLLGTFTGKAFDSAEKIIALNIDASRASLEKSSALVRRMIAARDPGDLLALASETQSQFDSMLAYGRRLFGIATGVAAAAPAPVAAPAPALNQWSSAPEVVAVQQPAAQPAAAATLIAAPNPVARALGVPEAPHPSAASFPVPSSSTPIAVAQVKPVDATPPPAPVSGSPSLASRKSNAPGAKAARKK